MSAMHESAPWFNTTMLALPAQAIAATFAVRLWANRIGPNIARIESPATVIDSLGPFALALPFIAAGWRVRADAAATGWIAVGGPIALAMLALGAAMFAAAFVHGTAMRSEDDRSHATSPPAAITWCGVGVILLLLGAANDLTVWVGQCAFALGAVLLWITTPELPRNDAHALEARVGGGLTLVLLCAVVHAAAMLVVPTPYLPIAGAIVIAEATMLLMLTAVQSGSHACIRLGGWCATYGVLLSLGAISLRQMIPQTLLAAGGDRGVPPVKVAYGFGAFAFEAMILIAISAAALAFDRLHTRQLRFTLAFALILLAAVLAAWRLSMM